MSKLSDIRVGLFRYINSVIWLQSRSIQDPLIDAPAINAVVYPPNTITEVPTERISVEAKSDRNLTQSTGVKSQVLSAIFGYRIVWIFSRQIYKTYHSLPIRQLEDLMGYAIQFVTIAPQAINQDVIKILMPSKGCGLVVRPAEDINSDDSFTASWAVVGYMNFDVEFTSNITDFLPTDFDKIQPPTWGLIDGGETIKPPVPFDFRGMNIELNQSNLPATNTTDVDSYRLDEELIIRKPIL